MYQVRLDLAFYRYEGCPETLEELIEPEIEPSEFETKLRFRAEALMTLGNVLVLTERWQEGLERYRQAQRVCEQLDDHAGTARALAAQGRANLDLVSSLGGLRAEAESLAPRATASVTARRAAELPLPLFPIAAAGATA